LKLKVQRGGREVTLNLTLRLEPGGVSLSEDPAASPKAARIRTGILRGRVDR
jgi:hypothetical protein